MLLAIAALTRIGGPAALPRVAVVQTASGCRLGPVGRASLCACRDYPARIRILLGLPLPLNVASEEDLQLLPGIGAVRAQAIAAERRSGGPFESVAALERVRGIGSITAERLRELLFVGEADPACFAPARIGSIVLPPRSRFRPLRGAHSATVLPRLALLSRQSSRAQCAARKDERYALRHAALVP